MLVLCCDVNKNLLEERKYFNFNEKLPTFVASSNCMSSVKF